MNAWRTSLFIVLAILIVIVSFGFSWILGEVLGENARLAYWPEAAATFVSILGAFFVDSMMDEVIENRKLEKIQTDLEGERDRILEGVSSDGFVYLPTEVWDVVCYSGYITTIDDKNKRKNVYEIYHLAKRFNDLLSLWYSKRNQFQTLETQKILNEIRQKLKERLLFQK